MDLEKWKSFAKEDFICKYDFQLMLILFGLSCLFEDLDLQSVSGFCFNLVLLLGGWWLGQLIILLIIRIIEKKRTKKLNIDKVIDEEIKKGK